MVGDEVAKTLMVMAETSGKVFSRAAVDLLVSDLGEYSDHSLLAALQKCRREIPRFPTLAEIILRIDDGRPGADEAWAMLPKSEQDTAVWTEEMRDAFGLVAKLLDRDEVAARMAFKENYLKLLAAARNDRKPVMWTQTLGQDPRRQAAVLKLAVEKGRLTAQHVQALLPEPITTPGQAQIAGPTEGNLIGLKEIMDRALQNAPARLRWRSPGPETNLNPADEDRRKRMLKAQLERLKQSEKEPNGI